MITVLTQIETNRPSISMAKADSYAFIESTKDICVPEKGMNTKQLQSTKCHYLLHVIFCAISETIAHL